MTTMEATDLAERIKASFTAPPLRDWIEELTMLDAGIAGTAYARCRREHANRWLSIADFLAIYRSLRTHDASTPREDCVMCDRTGWTAVDDIAVGERTYSQVVPCVCTYGQKAARSSAWTKRSAA